MTRPPEKPGPQPNPQIAQLARLGLLLLGLLGCGAAIFFLGPQLFGRRTSAPAPTALANPTSLESVASAYGRGDRAPTAPTPPKPAVSTAVFKILDFSVDLFF